LATGGLAGIFGGIGEPAELGIFLDEGWRGHDSLARYHCLQLKGVDSGLALEVIIGDHVGRLRLGSNVFDAFFPSGELFLTVKIVVAVVAVVGVEPLIVVAPVESNVGDGRGDVFGRGKRTAEDGLIDIAEGDILVRERGESFGVVPTGVAHFDDAGILDELAEEAIEIFAVERSVLERQRELNEEGAETSVIGEDVKTLTGASFVVVGGTDGRGGGRTYYRNGGVGEGAIQLGREQKIGVHGRDPAAPELGELGLDRSVERRVDLGGVEKAGEIFKRMQLAVLHPGWIEDTFPIFVGPASGAEANGVRLGLRQADLCRGSHEWNRRRRAGQD